MTTADPAIDDAPHADAAPDEPAPAGARWFRPGLAAITLGSVVLRVVYVLFERNDYEPWGDAYFYHQSAKLIADGEGWINPLLYNTQGLVVEAADHPPLYLAYLSTFSWLGLTSTTAHMLASVVLGTITIVLVGLLGRKVTGSPRAGLLAAGLASVYPNVWSHDGMIQSETMAILTATALILSVYWFRDDPSVRRGAVVGALVGLAGLSRAELLFLAPLVVVPACLSPIVGDWRRRIGRLVVAGLSCVVVLAPWVAHNLARFDGVVLLSSGFEITLATANCQETYYGDFAGYWSLACASNYLEQRDLPEDADQSERSEVLLEESTDFIRDNLDRLPTVTLLRWGRISGLYRPTQQVELDIFPEGRDDYTAWGGLVGWYVLAAGSIVGVVVLRRRRVPVYPLLGPPAAVLIAVTLTFATNRYRASSETMYCVLTAVALDAGLRWWSERERVSASSDEPAPAGGP